MLDATDGGCNIRSLSRWKVVLCISGDIALAATRELLLLIRAGCDVISVLGVTDGVKACSSCKADLLVLGHCISAEEKQHLVSAFRSSSRALVDSLLAPHQEKLPAADGGVEGDDPAALVDVIERLLGLCSLTLFSLERE